MSRTRTQRMNRAPHGPPLSPAWGGLLVALTLASGAQAYNGYQNRIPNGQAFVCANCHIGGNPSQGVTTFGADYKTARDLAPQDIASHWAALWFTDSDGDGQTNGQELGDPCGQWVFAAGVPPERTVDISNPGVLASLSPDPGSPDSDADAVCDVLDNCPLDENADQADIDGDGYGDVCDNCADVFNPDQQDADGDDLGNACDPDADNDTVLDDGDGSGTAGDAPCTSGVTEGCDDNCPAVVNPDQLDFEGDGMGDVCDDDDDNDGALDDDEAGQGTSPFDPDSDDDGACDGPDTVQGVCQAGDNCPALFNDDQLDTDDDGLGDVCDDDDDNDTVLDDDDNCILVPNLDQLNTDGDLFGDACDDDDDDDGTPDVDEAGQGTDPLLADSDADGFCDGPGTGAATCLPNDNCPAISNPDQSDVDNDGFGDVCDDDQDNDGLSADEEALAGTDPLVPDSDDDGYCDGPAAAGGACLPGDNCPAIANDNQLDLDGDGLGDVCDDDLDGDGLLNDDEVDTDPALADSDADGYCDGAAEVALLCLGGDNCPAVSNDAQLDTDSDTYGDVCDDDDDADGLADVDEVDTDPLLADTDNDGYCDGAAAVPNVCVADDNCPLVSNTAQLDTDDDTLGDACDDDDDNDGLLDADEVGTNPLLADSEADGFCDGPVAVPPCAANDNCPAVANADQLDIDDDDIGDVCDEDNDNDLIADGADNCPLVPNPDQLDGDTDLVGDACDNCPGVSNADQLDFNTDGEGDACDADIDGDGIDNDVDVCPLVVDAAQLDTDTDGVGDVCDNCVDDANADQTDSDDDGIGDACANDDDADGIDDGEDNCLGLYNPNQFDTDTDGAGDLCDICPMDPNDDADGDGACAAQDNCALVANPDQADGDGDGRGDACDNCPAALNGFQEDGDSDGVGDACDNCAAVSNPDQADTNNNGVGDACDVDDDPDGDGIGPGDNCPDVANADQLNTDGDTFGDACDVDDDGDVIFDDEDNCPLVVNGNQADRNNDGVGDACDDEDGDGVVDADDPCPDAANVMAPCVPGDGAPPDGGVGEPDAGSPDGGPMDDGDAPPEPTCSHTGPVRGGMPWALLGIIGMLSWRRRRG